MTPNGLDPIVAVLALQFGMVEVAQIVKAASLVERGEADCLIQALAGMGVLSDDNCRNLRETSAKEVESIRGLEQTLSAAGQASPSIDSPISVTNEHYGRYGPAPGKSDGFEIGRGGMGRVIAVFDEHLEREVAVKELLAGGGDPAKLNRGGDPGPPAQVARFVREARLTGQLAHPNIVPVYELGRRTDGTLYYAMKLVQGTTMADRLAKCRTLDQRLRLLPQFLNLSQAISYAHSRGVVHRDIKPHNVMLGEYGETVVLDWGLAKAMGAVHPDEGEDDRLPGLNDSSRQETEFGTRLGTPVYMSPEQAEGRTDEVDERSDVWSLGVVLYEVLVGRRPFNGVTAEELLTQVCAGSYDAPRQVVQNVSGELASICTKALQIDPAKRYANAGDLAADVEAYLGGARVGAYEYSSWELVRKFVARNRLVSALALVLLVVMLGAGVMTYRAYRDAEKARGQERSARVAAEANEASAKRNLAQACLEKSHSLADDNNYLAAGVFAAASLVNDPDNPFGRDEVFGSDSLVIGFPHEKAVAWQSTLHEVEAKTLATHHRTMESVSGHARDVVFSPEGDVLFSVGKDGVVRRWRVADGHLLGAFDAPNGSSLSIAISADGRYLATGGAEPRVGVWDLRRNVAHAVIEVEERTMVFSVGFSPDSKTLAFACAGGGIHFWDVATRSMTTHISKAGSLPMALAFSPSGETLASVGDGKAVHLYEARTAKQKQVLESPSNSLKSVAISPDGRFLASGAMEKVFVWDLHGEGSMLELVGHGSPVWSIEFFPDSKLLYTGSYDRTTRVWDVTSGTLLQTFQGHQDMVFGIAVSPDGQYFASTGHDDMIIIYRQRDRQGLSRVFKHPALVHSTEFSPDGALLATACEDGITRLWDPWDERLVESLHGHEGLVFSARYSPDGRYLLTAGADGQAILWDAQSRTKVVALRGHTQYVRSARFSGDGAMAATASFDGTVGFWQVPSGERLGLCSGDGGWVRDAVFLANSEAVATCDAEGNVKVWSVPDCRLLRDWRSADGAQLSLAVSPNGQTVASGGMTGEVLLWTASDWTADKVLSGHNGGLFSLVFSASGSYLASASIDSTTRLWDTRSGQQLQAFESSGYHGRAAFTPDGRHLAVAHANTVHVYPMMNDLWKRRPADILIEAQRRAGMTLQGFELVLDRP